MPGRVRPAGGVRAERHRDRRDAQLRHLGEVAEALPAVDEEVGLPRQVGARRLVQHDERQPVLADDLVEPVALPPGGRVRRAAPVGHVRPGDRALDALDDADAAEPCRRRPGPVCPSRRAGSARGTACAGRRAPRCARGRASCRAAGGGRRSAARRSTAPSPARRRRRPTALHRGEVRLVVGRTGVEPTSENRPRTPAHSSHRHGGERTRGVSPATKWTDPTPHIDLGPDSPGFREDRARECWRRGGSLASATCTSPKSGPT